MSQPRALVFDFDGVILQSVDIKTRAFSDLFAPEGEDARRKVVDYHKAHGGISRFEKFRWAYREVLKRPLSEAEEKRLGDKFNALVEEAVARCAFVPGAREFLEAKNGWLPFFVASGTPEEELVRIVERRALAKFFKRAYGAPKKKDAILREIAAGLSCEPRELIMIGDAMTDHDAAKAVGARFIGVATPGEPSAFPKGTEVLNDLGGLAAAVGAA